jgi:hypothetical protein
VTQASRELRTIPGVRHFGSHIGQAFLAEEVVGSNFGENWVSVDRKADYERRWPGSRRPSMPIPGCITTSGPTSERESTRCSRARPSRSSSASSART